MLSSVPGPNGRIIHAEIKIGDSLLFVADEFPEMPGMTHAPKSLKGSTMSLYVYTPDVDALHARAVKAGAKSTMPPADMFYGDRCGGVQDPFGHIWALATHKEDLTPEQLAERQKAAFAAAR